MSELTAAHSTIENAREVTNCPQGVELQDHLKALVAENLAMQTAIEEMKQVYYVSDGVTGYHLNGDIAKWDDVMPDLWAIETPATDSILREAEARGVEKFVVKTTHQFFSPESNAAQGLTYLVCANEFVKQLREGKAE